MSRPAVPGVVVPVRWREERSRHAFGNALFSVDMRGILPQIPALLETYYAFRDLIGLAWYRLRHGH
jgi:hypothetical protein